MNETKRLLGSIQQLRLQINLGNHIVLIEEGGQSLVELALCITLLFILLSGVVDLGRAFFTFVALRDAAQEGASYASTYPTDSVGIISRVRNTSNRPVDLSDSNRAKVLINFQDFACEGNGNKVQVQVRYQFPITMPFLGAFLGKQEISLVSSASDLILRPPCSP